MGLRGLTFQRQRSVPPLYKGVRLDCRYRADVVVEERVLMELKTVEHLLPIHVAQTATYLRLSDLEVALLVNFNVTALRQGLRRIDRNPSLIVPVGTALSGRPPDRTRRADFPHRAPTSGQRHAKRSVGQGWMI